MIRKACLLLVVTLLMFGSTWRNAIAQQPGEQSLPCEVRGQVASFGLYNGYSYFRLKDDKRVFIFFKVDADVVAIRMALVQSAYISGSTICFDGGTRNENMYLSIPQVFKNFNTEVENVVIPKMPYTTVYPAGTPGPAH
jgi:hypothetical protein